MTSTANVRHESGTTIVDGQHVAAWVTDYTDLPCRLATHQTTSSTLVIGEAESEQATRDLHFPHDTRLVDGAVVLLTSGEWAGTYWAVRESTGADQKTALRVRVVQIEKPGGWV